MNKLDFSRAVVAAIPSVYNIYPDDEQAILNLITPLKVNEVLEGEGDRAEYVAHCPTCNKEIKHETYRFCPYCGQEICWGWRD